MLAGAITLGTVIAPTTSTDAALPTGSGDLTNFEIDGNKDGTYDWDVPYTAPGTTPVGYDSTGLPNPST